MRALVDTFDKEIDVKIVKHYRIASHESHQPEDRQRGGGQESDERTIINILILGTKDDEDDI